MFIPNNGGIERLAIYPDTIPIITDKESAEIFARLFTDECYNDGVVENLSFLPDEYNLTFYVKHKYGVELHSFFLDPCQLIKTLTLT